MKIIFFTQHTEGTDGWSTYSRSVIQGAVDAGHECLCLVERAHKESAVRSRTLLRSPMRYLRFPFLVCLDIWSVRRQIRAFQPDVIHVLVEPYALFLPFIPKHIRTILTVAGTYAVLPLVKKRLSWLARAYYRRLDAIVAVSHYTKNRLVELLPSVAEKTHVIHNGIRIHEDVIQRAAQKVLPSEHGPFTILFIGGLSDRKGVKELVDGLAAFEKKYARPFTAHIVGYYQPESTYAALLKKTIDMHGLSSNVFIEGRVSHERKHELLQKADVFVMLSKVRGVNFEGFGLVYLEANEYGIPTIGPNDGGPTDAVRDGYSGLHVDISNPEAVADALAAVLIKKAISPAQCLAWAKDHSDAKMTAELFSLYQIHS